MVLKYFCKQKLKQFNTYTRCFEKTIRKSCIRKTSTLAFHTWLLIVMCNINDVKTNNNIVGVFCLFFWGGKKPFSLLNCYILTVFNCSLFECVCDFSGAPKSAKRWMGPGVHVADLSTSVKAGKVYPKARIISVSPG